MVRKPQGIEKEIMEWANDPFSDINRGVMGDKERDFLDKHFTIIAMFLAKKRLWRSPWSVTVDGCVYKFTVKGYAKKHSPIWQEQEQERIAAESQA